MAETFSGYEPPVPRPVFITVLCILTFIGSGWFVISDSIKYFTANTQAATLALVKEKAQADLQKKGESDEGARFAKKMMGNLNLTPESIRKSALAGIAVSILCLAGAVLMWNLKKSGFYLYVAGTLVSIVSPFVIFGGSNMMSIINSVGFGFIGLVFVILYGVNLRHMK